MTTVYLSLGSNLGNRELNIQKAIYHLENSGIFIEETSSVIETDPVGGPPQGKFFNTVLKVETSYSPHQLLQTIKSIEQKMGRKKTIINGPRVIDIDILLFDDQSIHTPELTIPHPRMKERDFVMRPLKEIAPRKAAELLHANH